MYCFIEPPQKENIEIDIPFFEQSYEILTDEILVNIQDADVSEASEAQIYITNNLSILIEYGIPSETVRKIERLIPSDLEEDNVITFILKNKERIVKQANLMQYEKERLEQCL